MSSCTSECRLILISARTQDGHADMAERLTDKQVKALEAPTKGSKIHYDADTKGFGVRVTAAGAKAFILNYYVAGRERRITIGGYPDWSVSAARERAKELRREIDAGGDPLGKRIDEREAPTIADLWEAYRTKHLPTKRKRSAADDASMWNNYILPKFRSTKVADLTAEDVDDLHRQIGATKKIRANRVIEVLSKALNLAVRWEWVGRNVTVGVQMYMESPRTRYASPAELCRVMDAIAAHPNQNSCDVIRMVILTGARKGEVFQALWEKIYLDEGVWVKPSAHTKQKAEHRVPLSNTAVQLLRRRAASPDRSFEWVFPGRGPNDAHITDVKKTWESCRAAATIAWWRESATINAFLDGLIDEKGRLPPIESIQKIAKERKINLPTGSLDLRMHDLRHTYASLLISNKVPLTVVGALLGHTQAQTTMRYAHLYDDPQREATEIAAGAVGRAGVKSI